MPEYIERETIAEFLQQKVSLYRCTDDIVAEYTAERYLDFVNEIPKADVVPAETVREMKNELCLYCGKYSEEHLGACDGCKWREI